MFPSFFYVCCLSTMPSAEVAEGPICCHIGRVGEFRRANWAGIPPLRISRRAVLSQRIWFNSPRTCDRAGAQMEADFELVIDLEPQKIKFESALFVVETVSYGRAYILNKSAKDATIHYNLNPAQFFRVEVFDKNGNRVVNVLYSEKFSPITTEAKLEFKIPKGRKVLVADLIDASGWLRQMKQPSGTYKVIVHYEAQELPTLSKEFAITVKDN
jgi:hypothetical protein